MTAYNIRVGCTDRDQHPVRYTIRLIQEEDGSRRITEPSGGTGWSPPADWYETKAGEGPTDHTPRHAHVFWCPSCPRTPQITGDKLWEWAEGLAALGRDFLDVSLVDY